MPQELLQSEHETVTCMSHDHYGIGHSEIIKDNACKKCAEEFGIQEISTNDYFHCKFILVINFCVHA